MRWRRRGFTLEFWRLRPSFSPSHSPPSRLRPRLRLRRPQVTVRSSFRDLLISAFSLSIASSTLHAYLKGFSFLETSGAALLNFSSFDSFPLFSCALIVSCRTLSTLSLLHGRVSSSGDLLPNLPPAPPKVDILRLIHRCRASFRDIDTSSSSQHRFPRLAFPSLITCNELLARLAFSCILKFKMNHTARTAKVQKNAPQTCF